MLIHHFLENAASIWPDKVALICGNQRLTYLEINRQADKLATALLRMGIEHGDRVVVFLDNSVASVISIFGILKAGAVFIMPNATMKSRKFNFIMKDSSAKVLITHINKARVVRNALIEPPAIENIIWCHGAKFQKVPEIAPNSQYGTSVWSSLLENGVPEDSRIFPRSIDVDLATIIYTSGSTGNPKGVMSAHYNVVSAVRSITQYLENTAEDIVLNALPLSFDYGLYQVLMTFMFGGTIILEKSFVYPYKIIEKIRQEKVTGFPIVPTMAAILFEMEGLARIDFESLRYITNTAAPLPSAYIKKLRKIFPHVKIYSMYGLTECKRVSYLPPQDIDRKPESVGIPMPNVEVFIVNQEGQEVDPNQVGELVIRGSNVMQGYWNAPDETGRTFRRDPVTGAKTLLYTGDLFRRDEEGYLYFVARKDDIIKIRGERVSPKEIENVLCEYQGVQAAAVIGVPDKIAGSAIKAFIVSAKGHELKKKELLRHCSTNLEPFMLPKYIEFRKELPRLPNGKIDKKKLDRSGAIDIDSFSWDLSVRKTKRKQSRSCLISFLKL